MKIKFWGTRGSIPVSEPEMMKYGGNTSCVEVRLKSGELLIFDAGTGIRRLGLSLLKESSFNKKGHILISHCHWDHIQGFPFFAPAFLPQYTWTIYGQLKLDGRLEDLLRWQMEHLYFPVSLSQMGATMKFVEIIEEDFYIGGAKITARHLNHPQGSMGFRVEDSDGIFVYCTDTEHYKDRMDSKLLELASNGDIVVYDGQYTDEEYGSHVGWGHSTWQAGVALAKEAKLKKLVIFHHDPNHDDDTIDKIVQKARKKFENTIAAQRDMEIILDSTKDNAEAFLRDCISCNDYVINVKVPKEIKLFNSPEFLNFFTGMLNGQIRLCIFDLDEIKEIDSASLRNLAKFYQEAKKFHIPMKLVHVSQAIREVLKISRFTGLVEVE